MPLNGREETFNNLFKESVNGILGGQYQRWSVRRVTPYAAAY